MATGIQWTDETWNPVVGCEPVSAGCDNCYAKQLHDMRHRARLAGKQVLPLYDQPFETVQLRPSKLVEPLHWRKPRRVFVNSMSDLFHPDVPESFLDQAFAVMALAQQHTFQILTKRPTRMRKYINAPGRVESIYEQWSSVSGKPAEISAWPLPNVWLGTSIENQAMLNKRLPSLMATQATVRFLSMEPLLERVEIGVDDIASRDWEGRHVDWVIVGGESGQNARPCHVEWIEAILAECDEFGVPVFVKQMGRWIDGDHEAFVVDRWLLRDGTVWVPPIIRSALNPHLHDRPASAIAFGMCDRHGGAPREWPPRFRIRQFPGEVAHA